MRVQAVRDIKTLGGRHVRRAGIEGTAIERYVEPRLGATSMRRVVVRWDDEPDVLWDEPADAVCEVGIA